MVPTRHSITNPHPPPLQQVVGFLMPHFCLCGDTVNTASRMQSTSLPMTVQVSSSTAAMLQPAADNTIQLESRGMVAVKGKGEMETFWLRKAPSAGTTEQSPRGTSSSKRRQRFDRRMFSSTSSGGNHSPTKSLPQPPPMLPLQQQPSLPLPTEASEAELFHTINFYLGPEPIGFWFRTRMSYQW